MFKIVNKILSNKWARYVILLWLIVGWFNTSSSDNKKHVSSEMWGKYEAKDGKLISVELMEDWGDGLYTAYIATSEMPWVKWNVVFEKGKPEIMIRGSMKTVPFEFKNRKVVFKETEYEKISDECLYDKVLDVNTMSIETITGIYKNEAAYYVVIENSQTTDAVNVIICDAWGNVSGISGDVPYTEFFENGEVMISIDNEEYALNFIHSDVIQCEAFMDAFIKQKKLGDADYSEDYNLDMEVSANEMLSIDLIKGSTENILSDGAYQVKEYVDVELLRSIDDFYIEFTIPKTATTLADVELTVSYCYECYGTQYGRIGFCGTFAGGDLQKIESDEMVSDAVDDYWTIVQGYKEGYQRLNDNRNDCWYKVLENGDIHYVYANWDNPKLFSQIVD